MRQRLTRGERLNGSRRAVQFGIGCGLFAAGAAFGLSNEAVSDSETIWVAGLCGLGATMATAALALHWFVGPVSDDEEPQ